MAFPFGPVKFYLSKAILKENYDKKRFLDLVLVQHTKQLNLRSIMIVIIITCSFILFC